MVSRGNLDYPSEELFDLSLYLYSYYKSKDDKSCINKILVAFKEILSFTRYEIPNSNSVLRRFVNCFSKAFTSKITDAQKTNDKKVTKKLRITNKRWIPEKLYKMLSSVYQTVFLSIFMSCMLFFSICFIYHYI